jgi:hypothetical protein
MGRPAWFEPVDSVSEWLGLVGGIVVTCGLIALGGLIAHDVATGDVTVDELLCFKPGELCRYSVYRVRNDTVAEVYLRWCLHHCGEGDRRGNPIDVAPGQVTANDPNGVTAILSSLNWWEVRSSSGRVLGCLVLDGHHHKRDGDLVLVSALGPCDPGAPATSFATA